MNGHYVGCARCFAMSTHRDACNESLSCSFLLSIVFLFIFFDVLFGILSSRKLSFTILIDFMNTSY